MKRKLVTIIAALILLFNLTLARAQENIRITTYYPSPSGVYNMLRLNPTSIQPQNPCARPGEMYYYTGLPPTWPEGLYVCAGGSWTLFAGVGGDALWTRTSPNLYPTNLGDRVGINTSSPGAQLDVVGNIRVSSSTANADINMNSATRPTIYPDGNNTPANLGMQIRSKGTGLLELNKDNSGNVSIAEGGGKVGIRKSDPLWPLDVNGDIMIHGSDGLIFDVPGKTVNRTNRALTAGDNDTLIINYDNDFTGGVRFGGGGSDKLTMGTFDIAQAERNCRPIFGCTLDHYIVEGFKVAWSANSWWVFGIDKVTNSYVVVYKPAGARPRSMQRIWSSGAVTGYPNCQSCP